MKTEKRITFSSNYSKQDIAASFCMVAVLVYYIIYSFNGICWEDEGFYLTVPYRLTVGDSLLSNEWHISQFSSFFFYLPVKLYILLTGGTDGIVHAFRVMFIPFITAVALFLYSSLRKYGIISVAATVIYYYHTPMGIRCANYNSLGVSFILVSALLLMHLKENTNPRIQEPMLIFSGLFYAFAVINNPLLASGYALLFLFAIFRTAMKIHENRKQGQAKQRKKTLTEKQDSRLISLVKFFDFLTNGRALLLFTAGISIAAVLSIGYFFTVGGRLSNISEYLVYIFSDSDHNYFSDITRSSFGLSGIYNALIDYFPWQTVVLAVIATASIIDYKVKFRKLRFIIALVVFAIFAAQTMHLKLTAISSFAKYYTLLPVFLTGTLCLPLSGYTQRKQALFSLLYLPGVFTALCYSYSSNMGLTAACFGLAVADIACIIFIFDAYREIRSEFVADTANKRAKPIRTVLAVLFVCIIGSQIFLQYIATDGNCTILNSESIRLERGPFAGLYYPREKYEKLNIIMDGIDEAENACGENAIPLFADNMPWEYLYAGNKYGTYTAWKGASDTERLLEYYKLNPDSIPDYAYISSYSYPNYDFIPSAAKNTADRLSAVFDCITITPTSKKGYILYIYGLKENTVQ